MAGLAIRVAGVLGAVTVIVMLIGSQPGRSSAMSGNRDIALIKAGADDGQEHPEHAPRGWLPVLGIAMVLAGIVIVVKTGRGHRREATERDVGRDESAGKQCPDCAKRVPVSADVCRFCGYRFDQGTSAS